MSGKKKENDFKNSVEILTIINKKIIFFQDLIQKTILHVQKNKLLDILGVNDVNTCFDILFELNKKIKDIENDSKHLNTELLINNLQVINNELSSLFKNYGTELLDDLLTICFGNNNIKFISEIDNLKFELLKKYFHPINYKVVAIKEELLNDEKVFVSCENNMLEKFKNIDCFDVIANYKQFHMKVYGMKLYLFNSNFNKCISIVGIVDDVIIDLLNNKYILLKDKEINDNLPNDENYSTEIFKNFKSSLILKDYFIYNYTDVYNRYAGYLSQINILKQKTLPQIIKDFMSSDTFLKRLTLIQLLIKTNSQDNLYLSYLLYDLLSNDNNEKLDTNEQIILFDSFPWKVKQYFKYAMKKTIQYTNELNNYDLNKIPLEQQICLINAPDNVKEKAIVKMKEIKGKSEDSGSKARLYLEGLLKIPFGIYKREPILCLMNNIKTKFKHFIKKNMPDFILNDIPLKENYTSIEIIKYIKGIQNKIESSNNISDIINLDSLSEKINNFNKNNLIDTINKINKLIVSNKLNTQKIKHSGKKNDELKNDIICFLENCNKNGNIDILNIFNEMFSINNSLNLMNSVKNELSEMDSSFKKISNYMIDVKETLNNAVYGHENAKQQIELIIGQWINGEQYGYCFGFEGPPGVGKTSLAKHGLSNCLKDENGNTRPFSMIQMGGDCNGSTLHGHNYTYIGSTWGSIVQIIIDKKCMNPIIFIDEVDKISNTEHGKEIIGILTHLLDSTQNDCFQDKYFTGIDLDLSKALFILSYNDVNAIDKILLDRIHRIKFDNLSLEDKLVISNKHILPTIYKKMGLESMIHFSDDVLKFIIEEYTNESGVRKLKEILFQIIGEINIDVLKNINTYFDFPINITIDSLINKYFKDRRVMTPIKIHEESEIGIINALWANSLGQGGTLPIQAKFLPSNKFLDLTLTGSQGDVMKESMNVALTVAWNLTGAKTQELLNKKYNDSKNNKVYGLHLHTPDCSTPKDGPSATAAITVTIYSIFNNVKIKNYFGITGELNFSGKVTEIGGLSSKFLGGIKAGIKEFIYPSDNQKDFEKFMDKNKNNKIIEGIKFHSVNTIQDVLALILENTD
jgi:ATP-dependent Lon protease